MFVILLPPVDEEFIVEMFVLTDCPGHLSPNEIVHAE